MNILEKLLMQNPQIQKLMSSNVDPKSIVMNIIKNNNVDISKINSVAEKFGYKIPNNILNDIKDVNTGTSIKRF